MSNSEKYSVKHRTQRPTFDELTAYLKEKGPHAIAFSGGVDSTLLLAASERALGDKALGITVSALYTPKRELEETEEIVSRIGARHTVVEVPFPEEIGNNPRDRCYLCKKRLFTAIVEEAKAYGIHHVFDGSNADDLQDFRPGMQALQEMGIHSPLLELGFTKTDIRTALREQDLPSWNKPSSACLLSRLPYDTEVSGEELQRVDRAENFLRDAGIEQVRVRSYGDSARIEVNPEERTKFFDTAFLDRIVDNFKAFGYRYVSLDLEGYATGKMNKKRGGDDAG